MNKKGGEYLVFSMLRIAEVIFFAALIAIIFTSFFSEKILATEAEEAIIADKISECMADMNLNAISKENLLECSGLKEKNLFVKVNSDFLSSSLIFGDADYEPLCGIKEEIICYQTSFYVQIENKIHPATILVIKNEK